jgi:hypothetical protein
MTQQDVWEIRELFEREAAWQRQSAVPIPPIEPEHHMHVLWAARFEHLAATVGDVPAPLLGGVSGL